MLIQTYLIWQYEAASRLADWLCARGCALVRLILPNVDVFFYVHWQGNKFGEMGGAYVQVPLDEST